MIKQLTCLIFLGATLVANAQFGPSRTLRFIGAEGNFTGLQMQADKDSYINLAVIPYGISTPCLCPNAVQLVLTKLVPVVSDTGKVVQTRKTVAVIPVPKGDSPFFVILTEAKTPAAPYPITGTVLEDSYAKYPAQSLRLLNLGAKDMAVHVGDTVTTVPAWGAVSFPFPSKDTMNSIQIATPGGSGWTLGFNGAFAIKPTQRAIAIAHDNPNPPNAFVGPILVNLTKERPPRTMVGKIASN